MTRFVLVVLVGCATSAESPAPSGGGKADGTCPDAPIGMSVWAAQPYACGPIDATTASVIRDVDRFWGSQLPVCGCASDFPTACDGAYATNGGWIYTNVEFVGTLQSTLGRTPIEYMYAHEYGHALQAWFGVDAPTLQKRELGADCLGGYFLGSLACEGAASEADIRATLETACVIADGTGDPLRDTNTHGTCLQRVTAVARGMFAYLHGQEPITTCTL